MSSQSELLFGGFTRLVGKEKLENKVVLELACGYGLWGRIIRSMVDSGGSCCYLVGCDIWKPYLKVIQKYNPYDDMVVCDIRFMPFRNESADLVLAFEVIEHLEKNEGLKLLEALKNIALNVVVSTPAGFYVQGKIRDNIHEYHKSGWGEEDFRNAGYSVGKYGLGVTMEVVARRLHLLNVLHYLVKLVTGLDWGNTQLVAQFSKRRTLTSARVEQ